jgi:hypothetical protein
VPSLGTNIAGLLNSNQLSRALSAGLNQMQLGQLAQMGPLGQFGQMSQIGMRFPGMVQSYMPLNELVGLHINNNLCMPQGKNMRPIQNLFVEQLKAYQMTPPTPNVSKVWKESFPLKRLAFHVGIAYKIYFDRMKTQGVSF